MRERLAILVTVALFGASAWGGGWRLSLAAGYRVFNDVDFAPLTLAVPGGSGAYVNGDYTDAGNYTILDDSQLQTAGWTYESTLGGWTRAVTFDQVSFLGGTESLDNAPGVVLELERTLFTSENGWEVGIVLGFSAFWSDMSSSAGSADLRSRTFTGMLFEPGGATDDPGATYPSTPLTVTGGVGPALSTPDDLDAATATTLARLGLDSDLGLYVFSLGGRASYTLGSLQFALAGGPTLNVVDFETATNQTVVFVDDGSLAYPSSSQSDDTLDVLVGAYASLDVSWMFHEGWLVRAGVRWDEVFDEVETEQASLDLSGITASLAVVWMF